MMRKAWALLLPAALLGAACGGGTEDTGATGADETTTTATEAPREETTTTAPAAGDAGSAGPITLEVGGQLVTLDAPAERIVVLEWDYAEHLMALGVDPVGVADIAAYQDWLASELPAEVTDVGTRQEPSLESIAALEPDLIIAVDFRHAAELEQYQAIAPTVLFAPYPAPEEGGELEAMRQSVRVLAQAIGDPGAAQGVLADLDEHLAGAAAQLEAAGLQGTEVALAQGFSAEGSPQIRMFTDNARVVELLGEIGLENGWDGPPAQYGFNTVDAEGLTALGDVQFMYVAQADDDVFADVLPQNPIWSTLPFVQSGRVHDLGADTWFWGGPQSAKIFVDRVVAQLTS
jgi:iron complex transport system substrate-binding protein